MPAELHGFKASDIHAKIKLLIDGMVNIKDTTGEFLLTLPDGRVIDTKGWDGWEWTHGIGLNGLWAYYSLTGDRQYLSIIEAWFAARFASGGTTKNINTMAVFLTLARVYEATRNATYLPWLDAWAEWAYHDLQRTRHGGLQHVTYLEANEQQLWADTLMMTVLPLARIGRLLARPHYVDEARRQFLLHVQYLFDARSGLFFHGWQFDTRREAIGGTAVEGREHEGKEGAAHRNGHHFAAARWARGNAWLTMAIPDFLELLEEETVGRPGEDAALRAHLAATLDAQVAALKGLQDAGSGLWRTLLDVPADEGSYVEASATAGFAYGILKAQRRRYVGKGYEDVALRAIRGILENIDEKGELRNTSFGTAMGRDLRHYVDIPVTSMPYGQAMAIMALVEFLRVFI